MPEYIIPPSPVVAITDRLVPRYQFTADHDPDPTNYRSYLGTPVYSPLEFLKTSGTSLDNSLGVGEARGNSKVFLRVDTVLFVVNRPKNIVKTPIAGRDNEVFEYISAGNFMIDIRGMIVGQYPNIFPRDEVRLLNELLSLPKTIPIACDFLSDIFGIDSIVVETYTIAQKIGSRNEVPFEIQAWSDLAEEITLNPNDQING